MIGSVSSVCAPTQMGGILLCIDVGRSGFVLVLGTEGGFKSLPAFSRSYEGQGAVAIMKESVCRGEHFLQTFHKNGLHLV